MLKQANYDIEKHQFNTVASACMKILNALEELPDGGTRPREEGLSILLRLLSPITPHVCHHLWRELGFGEDIMTAPWPEPDPAALEQDEIELRGAGQRQDCAASIAVPKPADQATHREPWRAERQRAEVRCRPER